MTTTSLPKQAFRFPRFIIAVSLLTLGFGLGSVQATVISNKQAEAAADAIMAKAPSDQYNAAVTIAQTFTANVGASDAAASAQKIVQYLSSKQQRLLAGRVGVGVGLNYPNQFPNIAMALAQMNSNMRHHVALLVYQMSYSGGPFVADQIAYGMNLAMVKYKDIKKQINLIAFCIMAGINNRTDYSVTQKADALATAAANLTAVLSQPDKHGIITTAQKTAITNVVQILTNYLNVLTANSPGSSESQTLIANAVLQFSNTLKTSTTGSSAASSTGTSAASQAVTYILRSLVKPLLLKNLGTSNAPGINQNIQDIINNTVNQVVDTNTGNVPNNSGNVNNGETIIY